MKSKTALIKLAKIASVVILLGIIVHTIAVLVTGASVRKAKEALEARGYPMTAAEIIPSSIPDDLNAAIELKKVFGLLTLGSGNPYNPGKSNGTLAEQYADIIETKKKAARKKKESEPPHLLTNDQMTAFAKVFESNESKLIFELLTKAADKKECYFNRNYEEDITHTELGLMNVCKLLSARAKYEAQLDHKQEAFQKIKESLILSNALVNEPLLISQLVRLACVRNSLDSLLFLSSKYALTESEIAEVYALTEPFSDTAPWIRALHGERLFYCKLVFESGNSYALDDYVGNDRLSRYYISYPLRPLLNSDHAFCLNAMPLLIGSYEMDPKNAAAEDLNQKITEQAGKLNQLAQYLIFTLTYQRIKLTQSDAMRQMTMIAIACNQYRHEHGNYPESLEAIAPTPTDPATGKPFVYQLQPDGAAIYSAFEGYRGGIAVTVDGQDKKVLGIEISPPTHENSPN